MINRQRCAPGGYLGAVAALALAVAMLASILLLFSPRSASAQTPPEADYRFQNTRSTSVGTAPALKDIGPSANTFASATVDGASRRVLRFPEGNGVGLSPTAGVVPNRTYTIVVLFAFDSVSDFRRVIDFKKGASDSGLYVRDGNLDFYPRASGTGTPIAANRYVQVALTRSSSGMVAGYVDGVQQFSFSDGSNDAEIDTNSDALRFFADNVKGGGTNEHSAGSVGRIRLYDRALTASEVGALDRIEPTAFIVNSALDAPDNNTSDGRCFTGNSANPFVFEEECTLRAAIQQANATSGKDTINFDIPTDFFGISNANCDETTRVCTISPTSVLPAITEAVTIDGYTQPEARKNRLANGTNAALKVELSGANVGLASRNGLAITASNSTVRGLVINRWDSAVRIGSGSANNKVQGNFLGTDASGTDDLGNGNGVVMEGTTHTVGGLTPAARNLISGNTFGVSIFDSGNNKVQGNLIGTRPDGTPPLGDSGDGVLIFDSPSNTVGGESAARNVIAFNARDGVDIKDFGRAKGNRILSNSIFSNGELGIDLNDDGVTSNDNKDPDTGANNLQNYPGLSSVKTVSGGKTTIEGKLNSTPGKTFTVQFFSSPDADPSGFGEGKKYLGQKTVTTGATGNVSFTFQPAVAVPAAQKVTATATDAKGNTSEFSRAR